MNATPSSRSCIIVFVRAPVIGAVKTRLANRLADHVVLELYCRFVTDTLTFASECAVPIRVFFAPPESGPDVRRWLGGRDEYCGQEGQGVGERMARAFERTFADGFEKAVLIGTDFPDLPARILSEGLASLDRTDTVIGPALDGGYYLIGFKTDTYSRDVFQGISWSTETVCQATKNSIRDAGLGIHTLPQWRDIDTLEDLAELAASLEGGESTAANTFQYMRSIGLIKRSPKG